MPHPHQAFLDEFKFAIDHLVPLTPPEIVEEAKKLHAELQADEAVLEKAIHQAMVIVGRKEYPYRKAFNELCASDEESRLQKLVFERLDEDLAKKLKEVTSHGVIIEDFVKSKMFEEELTPEERYRVEQAILLADDILKNQCDERANQRKAAYDKLVEKWKKEEDRLQGLIDQLRKMSGENPKWKGEIDSICDRLEEGWSVTEKDPKEEEIKKELEYWNTVLHEEGE